MFFQLHEIGLERYTILCFNSRQPNGSDATNIHCVGLSMPYETSTIPSSTSRSEAPSRLMHVSSVNLGDFSINCSIHAYRRLTDPRQCSLLRPQRHSHDCIRRFFYMYYRQRPKRLRPGNLTYARNVECKQCKTLILSVGANADRVAD